MLAAPLKFVLEEAIDVMVRGVLDRRVLRLQRLHDDTAMALGAPGASGDLHEELERSLARTEVALAQRVVRQHHADERHERQVEALRDHLRPHQDIRFLPLKLREDLFVLCGRLRRVAVPSRDTRGRVVAAHFALHLLRAGSEGAQGPPTLGAVAWQCPRAAALVTDEPRALVQRHRHIA